MDKNKLMSHKTFFFLMAAAFAVVGILRALFADTYQKGLVIAAISVAAAIILTIVGVVGGKKPKQ